MKILKQLQSKNWLVVVFFLFIVELLINPIGEFPLNDDWAYSRTVYDYVNTGIYKLSFWQSIFGFTQFFVGVIFCKLFGFSFTLLRYVSLLCLVISIYFFDKILKHLNIETSIRFFLLLLFTFNPLTISLSNTFLSDGFQMPLTLATFYFMLKFLSEDKWRFFILFNLFLVLSILNRQNAIVFSIIFLTLYFHQHKINFKNVLIALFPMLISVFSIWIFTFFVLKYAETPPNLNLQWHQFQSIFSNSIIINIKKFFYYFVSSTLVLGLFILPVSLSVIKLSIQKLKGSFVLQSIFVVYVILISARLLLSNSVLPFAGNIFYHVGAGPIILSGFDTNNHLDLSLASSVMWIVLNFLGGLSFFISIITIFFTEKQKIHLAAMVFFLLMLLYLLPLCFNYVNDRYLFYLLPFYFMAFVASVNFKLNKFSFLIAFIPLMFFSVASTHDYLEINRARESAAKYLFNKKIAPDKIDGGFEFNAWYFAGSNHYNPSHTGTWWWVQDDSYMITPFEREGYKIENEFYFSPWLFTHFKKIKVLKRE